MKQLTLIPWLMAALALMTICVDQAQSAATIYEPFDYAAGAVNGTNQAGGVGMDGAWTTSTADGGRLYVMQNGALSFSNLPVTGAVRARRSLAPGGAEMHRPVSSEARAALTGSARRAWFSVLVRTERFSVGNENGTFVLGSAALDATTTDGALPTIGGGEGFGVHLGGQSDGTIDIFAYTIDNGTAARSSEKLNNTNTIVNTFLIAGRIDWAPNGSDDTLRLFNIADAADEKPADEAAFAMMTADLEESLFDTLGLANRQISSLDEIRFATTFAEIMGREPLRGTAVIIR